MREKHSGQYPGKTLLLVVFSDHSKHLYNSLLFDKFSRVAERNICHTNAA